MMNPINGADRMDVPQNNQAQNVATNNLTITKIAKVAAAILVVGGLVTAGVFLAPHLAAIGGAISGFAMSKAGLATMAGIGVGAVASVYNHIKGKNNEAKIKKEKEENRDLVDSLLKSEEEISQYKALIAHLENENPWVAYEKKKFEMENVYQKEIEDLKIRAEGKISEEELDALIQFKKEAHEAAIYNLQSEFRRPQADDGDSQSAEPFDVGLPLPPVFGRSTSLDSENGDRDLPIPPPLIIQDSQDSDGFLP